MAKKKKIKKIKKKIKKKKDTKITSEQSSKQNFYKTKSYKSNEIKIKKIIKQPTEKEFIM